MWLAKYKTWDELDEKDKEGFMVRLIGMTKEYNISCVIPKSPVPAPTQQWMLDKYPTSGLVDHITMLKV